MIPNNFDTAFETVVRLVEDFSANLQHCNRSEYNESQVRKDYIDKFFIALGWDVNHEQQRNIYAQEVRVEPSVNVAERVKKADYSFSLAPEFRKIHFFVEAKKPSIPLETAANCFQTLRYGYSSSKANLSILTNFKELIVLDCRYLPDFDTATQRIHKRYDFTDFLNFDKFAEIYYLFGREAVADGTYERVCSELPKPKGRVKQLRLFADGYKEVDDSFLEMLEGFREELAKNFKKKNPALDSDDLTEAVQRTLDRLVFIRFLEDKLIEPDTILDKFGFKPNPWGQFIAKSRDFDKTYNGIIFKYHDIIDNPNFVVDDRVFLQICDTFAGDRTPYHFNYIPIHILGSIYERFLGNIIVATAKQARIEAKPEVRKAGGVFYTPQYIVKYIVENTVGKLLEKKTPQDVEEMRFADIACGSGSFLLGVFEYLLTWHTEYYNKKSNAKEAKEAHCIVNEDGTFHLSFEQKSDILVNNVYGVDIDRQAHEVTQLSLFLKLLEEETLATKRQLWDTERKAMLPSLAQNIICGNALVDWDLSSGDLFEQLDQEKEKRLNPMSFDSKFPAIMRNGGFDAIVGNPPYVRQEQLGDLKDYLKKHYEVFHGAGDLYTYFLERYFRILHQDGIFGVIVSNGWMRAKFGEPLRKFLKTRDILEIVDFGDLDVFKGVAAYPCILRVTNAKADTTFRAVNASTLNFGEKGLPGYISENSFELNQSMLLDDGWTLTDEASQRLLSKLRITGRPLGEYVKGEIYRGVLTGLNEAFVIDEDTKRRLIASDASSAELIKPFLLGRDIKRYINPVSQKHLIFIPKGWTNKNMSGRSPWNWFKETFPAISQFLAPFAKAAEKRQDKGDYWWELRACNYYDKFEKPKIFTPTISKDATLSIDLTGLFGNDKTNIIVSDDKYLLGVLNSRCVDYFMHSIAPQRQGGFYEYKPTYLAQLPIHQIDENNSDEKAKHDVIVHAVEQIMDAKAKLATAKNDGERQHLADKCEKYETDIDDAIFSLYGLTDDEIRLVSGA